MLYQFCLYQISHFASRKNLRKTIVAAILLLFSHPCLRNPHCFLRSKIWGCRQRLLLPCKTYSTASSHLHLWLPNSHPFVGICHPESAIRQHHRTQAPACRWRRQVEQGQAGGGFMSATLRFRASRFFELDQLHFHCLVNLRPFPFFLSIQFICLGFLSLGIISA